MERHTYPVKSVVAPEIRVIDEGITVPQMLASSRMKPVVEPLLVRASLAARTREAAGLYKKVSFIHVEISHTKPAEWYLDQNLFRVHVR